MIIYLKSRRKNITGMSILEAMLSLFILSLLLSISSKIMYESLRISKGESGLAFVRTEAVKAITWFTKDLRRTNGYSFMYNVTPVSDVPVSISCLTTIGNDVIGSEATEYRASPKWKSYVVYYLKPDPKNPGTAESSKKYLLKRMSFKPSGTYYNGVFNTSVSVAKTLQTTDLINVCSEIPLADKPRVVARNIYEINVTEKNIHFCTISIDVRDRDIKGGEIKSVYSNRILMRNTVILSN